MRYKVNHRNENEKGSTLLIVAAGMVFMLGMCALAIDLVTGYLARVQCQRAADAAALAGAKTFIGSACTSTGGCSPGGPQEAPATQQAITVAGQNLVMGLAPTSSTISTSFSYPNPEEPQITVTVYRDENHGDQLATLFGKIFGINYMNISASATAEAYNPTGGDQPISVGCIKPFLVPNCDPNFPVYGASDPEANSNCECQGTGLSNGDCAQNKGSGWYMSYYIHPGTSPYLVHPGVCDWTGSYCAQTTGSGDVGAPWVLHSDAVPSQWYTIAFYTQSGQQYKQYIQQCAPVSVACTAQLDTLNGKKVGPTDQGIDDLIHASADGLGNGQDYMCSPSWPSIVSGANCSTPPFTIVGGSGNPDGMKGKTFTSGTGISDSLTQVVLYDGAPLAPGGSTVNIDGYMGIFIQEVQHSGTDDIVSGVVTNLGMCGGGATGGGGGGTQPVGSPGGSFIPIRLIRKN